MKKIITLVTLVIAISLFSETGYYIKTLEDTPQIMGMSAEKETTETYICGNNYKEITKDDITILRDGKIYTYQIDEKIYYEQTIEEYSADMEDEEQYDFDIKSAGTTEKVGKWTANKYFLTADMGGMKIVIEMYFAEIGIPREVASMFEKTTNGDSEEYKKMKEKTKDIKGYPVKTVVNMMGQKMTTTVVDFKKMDMSKNTFDGPAGYQKVSTPQF